jgi:putative iron-regulated protein
VVRTRWALGLGIVASLSAAALALALLAPPRLDPVRARRVVEDAASFLFTAYAEAVTHAALLRDEIRAFTDGPSAAGLEACKAAWVRARPAYLRTEVARFSGGPIDRSPDGPETFINAWPLDESYVDSVEGSPAAGIINDPARFPAIDEATLRKANGAGGEANITTGWHAIEFLLWGQDLSPGPGGGARPFTDFVDGGTRPNAPRRRAYLRLCADLLVRDLEWVRDQWAPGQARNYRAEFLAMAPEEALSRLMTGLGTMAVGELRGERLSVPFTLKDKEEEHSCFSDTTHLDHLHDALGIRALWDAGLRDLGAQADRALAEEVSRSIDAAIEALRSPDLNPFDQAILGDDARPGRRAIQKALDALARFNESFTRLARAMGVAVTTRLP